MEQSYKEKYEDILARLERAKNDNEVCDERFCCVIDDIIPELAESEDEKVRKEIVNYFQCQSLCGREHYGGMIGRLCHLKPKQKQTEWSENDKAFLDDILCKLEHDLILNKDEKDWLKSLRPQSKQEWGEEDEKMLGDIIKESDTKKIIVEIFGVRHRLVGDNSNKRFSCEKECSLHEVCKPLDDCIADDFIKLVPFKCHFEKEEICG